MPLDSNSVFQDNKYSGVYGDLTWTTPAGTLTVIPAYRHSSIDYMSPEAGFRIDQTETDNQTSLEARFASKTDQPLRYCSGRITCTRALTPILDTPGIQL